MQRKKKILSRLSTASSTFKYNLCYQVDFDLSEIMFITTANRIDQIPGPLRDRMEILDFSGYILDEKVEIANRA